MRRLTLYDRGDEDKSRSQVKVYLPILSFGEIDIIYIPRKRFDSLSVLFAFTQSLDREQINFEMLCSEDFSKKIVKSETIFC